MKTLKKEIITKTHLKDGIFVESTLIYNYNTEEERNEHLRMMQNLGYKNTGKVRETIDLFDTSKFVWYGEYYRSYTEERRNDENV